ncbi:hypothetical protein DPMN_163952 [Dreissena polymorpha]|uniref:Uncharacterized protein n=1 Tax=Dreissena polymorpha TaxID=45954 RepID=A0A9D4IV37_DREPO|nr:hypothetical protein DPMN_163952 [Dreissena polymorpha]
MPALQLTVSCKTSDNAGLTTDRILQNLRQCWPYNVPYLAQSQTMPALQLTVSCTTSHNAGLTTDRILQNLRQCRPYN